MTLVAAAFGDVEAGIWGVAWSPSATDRAFVCLDAPGGTLLPGARLEGTEPSAEWRLVGEGVSVTLAPLGEPAVMPEGGGFDQVCRARGSFTVDGTSHELDCLGCRNVRTASELETFESIREVWAWFEPADALALLALRPRKARGHEGESVTAAVIDAETAAAVADPRLSTTYSGDGRPARAGLELWFGGEEHEYPRRAAGEAAGPFASGTCGEHDVLAELFRWHSRGSAGTGVYLLARRR